MFVRSRSNWNLEVLVFEERGKPGVPRVKPFGAKERTNNKLSQHMASPPGFEPSTAPPLLPQSEVKVLDLSIILSNDQKENSYSI